MRDNHFHGGLLENRAVLAVTGPDAGHFLQNLLTADIEQLEEGAARYAALLNPQGKILFDMIVLRRGEGFLIDCDRSQRADLMKRLSMYKLRARVEIVVRDDLAVSVSPQAIPGGFPDPRTPEIGWRAIGKAAGPAQGYDSARIALGLADSAADIGSSETFPHEANLDQLGGVSFRKGCYVGQEVVSRMEHRGLARNRILPVRLSAAAPGKGTAIRSGDKQVGTLLSSSGDAALALLRLDRLAEAGEPLLAEGAEVTVIKPSWVRYDVPGAA